MKTVIFDFDGTMVDSLGESIILYNEIAPSFGVSVANKREIKSLRNKGAREVIEYLGIPLFKIPAIAKKLKSMVREKIGDMKPVTGLKEIMIRIKKGKNRIGIISSNNSKTIRLFLENNAIDFIDFIHTGSNLFGKHLVINKFSRTYKIRKEDIIYVGDEIRDIEACRKAGVKIISVCWGYNSKASLGKLNKQFLAENVEDIIGFI
jgi:phosphoglycolate phosphatase